MQRRVALVILHVDVCSLLHTPYWPPSVEPFSLLARLVGSRRLLFPGAAAQTIRILDTLITTAAPGLVRPCNSGRRRPALTAAEPPRRGRVEYLFASALQNASCPPSGRRERSAEMRRRMLKSRAPRVIINQQPLL
jgi:hypothetical protein